MPAVPGSERVRSWNGSGTGAGSKPRPCPALTPALRTPPLTQGACAHGRGVSPVASDWSERARCPPGWGAPSADWPERARCPPGGRARRGSRHSAGGRRGAATGLPPPPPLTAGAAGAEWSGPGWARPGPPARRLQHRHHSAPTFPLPAAPSCHHARAHRQRGSHHVRPGAGRGAAAGGTAAPLPWHGQCVWALCSAGGSGRAVGPSRVGWAGLGCLGGLQGSDRLPQILPVDPPSFRFPLVVSVVTQMSVFST